MINWFKNLFKIQERELIYLKMFPWYKNKQIHFHSVENGYRLALSKELGYKIPIILKYY